MTKSNKAAELKLNVKRDLMEKELQLLEEAKEKAQKTKELAAQEAKMRELRNQQQKLNMKNSVTKNHSFYIEQEKKKKEELAKKIEELNRMEQAMLEKCRDTSRAVTTMNDKIKKISQTSINPTRPFELL